MLSCGFFLDGKFLGLGKERMIGESVLICMLF
ncbi:unknown [Firmicutes bacterium CAG:114]|nr:unknown [Firmicutes bacterium CAG:114]